MLWNLERFKDNTAVIDESGEPLTYAQMSAEAGALACAVRRRCLVFALCKNTIGSVLGYAAFMNAGTVPVLLDRHLDPASLKELPHLYAPSFLWASIPKY